MAGSEERRQQAWHNIGTNRPLQPNRRPQTCVRDSWACPSSIKSITFLLGCSLPPCTTRTTPSTSSRRPLGLPFRTQPRYYLLIPCLVLTPTTRHSQIGNIIICRPSVPCQFLASLLHTSMFPAPLAPPLHRAMVRMNPTTTTTTIIIIITNILRTQRFLRLHFL